MQIRVGCGLTCGCPQPTPMILTRTVHYSRVSDFPTADRIRVPLLLGNLGLGLELLMDHIAWDPGAAAVARVVFELLVGADPVHDLAQRDKHGENLVTRFLGLLGGAQSATRPGATRVSARAKT